MRDPRQRLSGEGKRIFRDHLVITRAAESGAIAKVALTRTSGVGATGRYSNRQIGQLAKELLDKELESPR